jgi:hypothetical protein
LTYKLSLSIPDEAWYDPQHVNEKGAPLFSKWLGQELAKAYPPNYFNETD